MAIGCGLLAIAGGVLFVAVVEERPLALVIATPVVLVGIAIAAAGGVLRGAGKR